MKFGELSRFYITSLGAAALLYFLINPVTSIQGLGITINYFKKKCNSTENRSYQATIINPKNIKLINPNTFFRRTLTNNLEKVLQ